MKRIGILSDTHSYLDDRIIAHLSDCHEIWHGGDIGNISVVEQLRSLAPLRAVYGNIDDSSMRLEFPLNNCFELEGVRVYITHIAGRPGAYPARVKSEINAFRPGIFVCGHSHICLIKMDPNSRLLHINPGAAGRHGFHRMRTMAKLSINEGKISNLQIVELGLRALSNPV